MKFFVDRPVATAMIFLSLLVLGVYSFLNTPLELAPKEDYPQVDIQTSWPGVPPEIVQTKITAPLEEVAATVKGKRISLPGSGPSSRPMCRTISVSGRF